MISHLFGQKVTETKDRARAVGAAVRIDGKLYRPPIEVLATLQRIVEPGTKMLSPYDLSMARVHGLKLVREEVGRDGDPGVYRADSEIKVMTFFEPIKR